MSGRKSLAELAAELEDPEPKDLDPEAFGKSQDSSDDDAEIDANAGREHYTDVSKSRLRKQEQPSLGPRYSGSKVRRQDLGAFDDDLEDDPFGRKSNSDVGSEEESNDEDYDDPDTADLKAQDDEDEEIDSDEAFGEGEEETFRKKGFTFKDSGKSKHANQMSGPDVLRPESQDGDMSESLQGESDESSLDAEFDELQMNEDSSEESQPDDDEATDGSQKSEDDDQTDRDAVRIMMQAEQKGLVSSLSRAMESEASKGVAIKRQYATFDSFVGARVHLQKSLIAANSLPMAIPSSDVASLPSPEIKQVLEAATAAEDASRGLLNKLTSYLHSLQRSDLHSKETTFLGKRPFSATQGTSLEDIQQALNAAHQASQTKRREILTRWANKTQTASLSTRNRIVQGPTQDNLITALDGQLTGTNRDRLLQRTRIPRSCAPLQQAAASNSKKTSRDTVEEDDISSTRGGHVIPLPVYDDADFYALTLRELIDHKKSYSDLVESWAANSAVTEATNPSNLLRINKTKRLNVDTKASKGRKMKYTVHEKLQNFMAPINLSTWEPRQAEELFGGLLGRKIPRLDETDEIDVLEEVEEHPETRGLRLFGGN